MTGQTFSLIPFPAPHLPAVIITGRISLQEDLLSLHYAIEGKLDQLVLPPISQNPSRRDELWKATCFEFFLAIQEQPGYWEFNMSPSGDWNTYRMDAYRRIGFREETGISQLPIGFKKGFKRYSLDASVDLSPLAVPDQELQIGITAIIQSKGSAESYWALAHPSSQPDFHLRESFILRLAAQTHPAAQSALDG